jgi:hypothetical protein
MMERASVDATAANKDSSIGGAMKSLAILIGIALAGSTLTALAGDSKAPSDQKEATMVARGTFDVKVTPLPPDDSAAGPFARLLVDKQFHGDLEGTSKGHMLAAQTAVEGSGAYVAFELVTGTLAGKRGSFMFQHRGTMQAGNYNMDVTVVPDSGTDELVGISGMMRIIIEGKKHSYEMQYSLKDR